MMETDIDGQWDPTFTPLFFHALSDEIKILLHLGPKFAKKLTFSKSEYFNFYNFLFQSTFLQREVKKRVY